MFSFLLDADNYDTRKIGRDDFDWGFVSTARVSDGREPYETAVKDNRYDRADGDKGGMAIVECYSDAEAAKEGHAKWIAAMTAETLPEKLADCQNSEVSQWLPDGDDSLVWTLRK